MAKGGKKVRAKAAGKIRIRMHTVGFGDCFLLFLPTAEGTKKVLIDCGSLKNKSRSIGEIAGAVRSACEDKDGISRIDVVVMTHRHLDHISGFTPGTWDKVEVREVWMPWLESTKDEPARKARKARERQIRELIQTFQAANVSADLTEVLLNARSNEDSLNVLHEGFAGRARRRFLPESESVVESFETAVLPGIKVYVLGPPRDKEALKPQETPKGESFFKAHLGEVVPGEAAPKFQPLNRDWVSTYRPAIPDLADIRKSIEKLAVFEAAAAYVDAELNNTSLILIFQLGQEFLLFPGDAQWRPWEKILQDEDALALLEKVTFVKIGHHASHNASPVSIFKRYLGKKNCHDGKLRAMISVTPYAQWKGVPHKPLLAELATARFTTANSNLLEDQPGFTRERDLWLEAEF
jgi:beta-lactamase superfamily II metal-dependent hydrolase